MKKFITILSLALASTFAFSAETEKVCIDKMTKLEGTKVPEKK